MKKKPKKPPQKPPLLDLTGWIKSDHYHCPECSAVISFIDRIPWQPGTGVRAMGTCKNCGTFYIESEKSTKPPKRDYVFNRFLDGAFSRFWK